MSYKVLDEFKETNKHLEIRILAENLPQFGDGVRMNVPGTRKADSAFEKYVIDPIKQKIPGNTVKNGHKTSSGNREW